MATPLAFAVILYTRTHWSRWLNIGQRAERITGVIWIITAALSLICVCFLALSRKRWDVWIALTLNWLFIAFTVFPGIFLIPWLMHWLTGPGA
jgi:hypothetical protein